MFRFASGVSLLGVMVAFAGCAAPLGTTCDSSGACAPGAHCLPGGCVADARLPFAGVARRLILGPSSLAVVEDRGPLSAGEVPAWVTMGRTGTSSRALLMRFDVPADAVVDTAYLLVDRVADGASDGAGVSLHAERIVGPWGSTATWVHGPPLGEASPSLELHPGAKDPLRIDVTSFYRATPTGSSARGDHDEGVALLADRSTARGVAIAVAARAAAPGEATIVGGDHSDRGALGRAPRLELYVR